MSRACSILVVMQKIIPNIWCQGTADEAAEYYVDLFSHTPQSSHVHETITYPTEGLLDFQESLAGKTLTVEVELAGTRFILINAGEEFLPNPALSFMLNFDPAVDRDAKTHLEEMWQKLSSTGKPLMPLDSYPFSSYYAWVEDPYGVSWQLHLADVNSDHRPFIIPSLMFGDAAQNRAKAGQEKYLSIFPDSRLGSTVEFSEATGPAEKGALMFSDFQIAGQWFSARDAGMEQNFTFNEGISLMYQVHGQEELDAVWHALSAVPEAEVCGWLKDEFGVSWQIVPDNLSELMAKPGAFEKLMGMGKIQIDEF